MVSRQGSKQKSQAAFGILMGICLTVAGFVGCGTQTTMPAQAPTVARTEQQDARKVTELATLSPALPSTGTSTKRRTGVATSQGTDQNGRTSTANVDEVAQSAGIPTENTTVGQMGKPQYTTPFPTIVRATVGIVATDEKPARETETPTESRGTVVVAESVKDPRDGMRDWFIRSLTEEDRTCLPQNVQTNGQAIEFLAMVEKSRQGDPRDCMSEAGQIAAHLLTRGSAGRAYGTEVCIWRATRVERAQTEEPEPTSGDRILTKEMEGDRTAMRMTRTAVAAYCAQPDAGSQAGGDSETEQILACLVKQVGGPDRFMAANLQRNTVLEEFELARSGRGACAVSR